MNINNLDLYNQYENYYNLYTTNNTQLNNIIQNIIQKYNFDYNPEKYYRLDDTNIITRNIYELSGIIIMLNAILEKNFYGFCIKTGKKYKCEKMHCSTNCLTKYFHITYHFNCSGDEFIILFSWEYFSPILIHYHKDNSVFNINYRYSDITNFIHASNINYSIPYYPKDNYMAYSIGLMHNAGHYYWQEINGFMLLFEYDLIKYIDEFIIYKYDYLNIANILKNKYNKKVTYLNSDNDYHHGLTINLSKHFINNSLIDTFKNIYGLKDIINNNEIHILFDIRSSDRIWLNQIPIIINIMNYIKQQFTNYSVNFYISGFYIGENINNSHIYNKDAAVDIQNNIFNIIQSNVSFSICNLINLNLSHILEISQKFNLCIANAGSGLSFFVKQYLINQQYVLLQLDVSQILIINDMHLKIIYLMLYFYPQNIL